MSGKLFFIEIGYIQKEGVAMSWLEDIVSSIKYMEEHLTDELTLEKIADEVNLSPFYFQKGFSILCGVTVSEYIRNRRLSLAGRDLQIDRCKVIDAAMKYGYDSPDSFTKAFTRFHGITPAQAKNGEGELKNYLPLKIHLSMKGGFEMECKIVKKPAFTVIGSTKVIKNEEGHKECPKFWTEHFENGNDKSFCVFIFQPFYSFAKILVMIICKKVCFGRKWRKMDGIYKSNRKKYVRSVKDEISCRSY